MIDTHGNFLDVEVSLDNPKYKDVPVLSKNELQQLLLTNPKAKIVMIKMGGEKIISADYLEVFQPIKTVEPPKDIQITFSALQEINNTAIQAMASKMLERLRKEND